MPIPTSRRGAGLDDIAADLDNTFTHMLNQAEAFRAKVTPGTSILSTDVVDFYQILTSSRRHVGNRVGVQGLPAAYGRRHPNRQGGNIAQDWVQARQALNSAVKAIKDVLPTNIDDKPILHHFDPVTDELTVFAIPLTEEGKTNLITALDAVLEAFD